MAYAFGEHMLDFKRRELRRRGELIDVEPQVFDLLTYLIRHRDRVVSKDDLLDGVWGGRIVSDSALTDGWGYKPNISETERFEKVA